MLRFQQLVLAIICIVFLSGISKCSSEDSQVSSADDLVNAFSQACSLGPWTQAALDRSSSITAVYNSLLDKASCKGNPNLQKALMISQSLQAELAAIQADAALSKERKMEEASNDLMLALSQPGINADVQSGLIDYYTSARYELSMARADADYIRNPGYRGRITQGMTRINSQMRDLLAASSELGQCYKDNPSVALTLATSMTELAGSFATPIVGLGASAIAGLIKLGIEAVRTYPAADAVFQSRRTRMPVALSCGLEALARDYCKAKDARTLLDVSIKEKSRTELPFFKGIILQDRYLPQLYTWLDRVVNGGSSMRDTDQASRINLQFSRINKAQNSQRSADGVIAEAQNYLDKSKNGDDRIGYIRQAIRRLVDVFFSCGDSRSPDNFACSDALFYEVETAQSFVRKIAPLPPSQNFTSVNQLIDALSLQPTDLPMIVNNLNGLVQSRYQAVVQEFNDKVNVDLSSLVRAASMVDKFELSPMLAIEKLFHFFNDYAYESGTNGKKDEIIISQVRSKVETVYNSLLDPNSVSGEPVEVPCPPESRKKDQDGGAQKCYDVSPAAKLVSLTYETFKLDKNNVYLPGVLKSLVQADLTTRYLKGEGPKEIDELYRLAGGDISYLLQRSGLTPARVRLDLDRAQSISSNNLSQFRDFFTASLQNAMQDLKNTADRNKEGEAGSSNSPNRNVLSQLCLLTLVSGMEWPKDIDKELCKGTKLISKEAALTLRFENVDARLHDKSLDDRLCEYEEFLRIDRLANLDLRRPDQRKSTDNSFLENLFLSESLGDSSKKDFYQRLLDSRE